MEQIKILIADDMEIIAENIRRTILTKQYVEVLGIAKDGQEEYDKIIELQPDLVFTDNQMPKMNGIDVIELVNSSQLEKKPKFVLITGDRDIELYKRASDSDVICIVNKPIDNNRLLEIIEEFRENDDKIKEKDEKTKEVLELVNDEKVGFFKKIFNYFRKNKKK